jgi:hypothetical protein
MIKKWRIGLTHHSRKQSDVSTAPVARLAFRRDRGFGGVSSRNSDESNRDSDAGGHCIHQPRHTALERVQDIRRAICVNRFHCFAHLCMSFVKYARGGPFHGIGVVIYGHACTSSCTLRGRPPFFPFSRDDAAFAADFFELIPRAISASQAALPSIPFAKCGP